MNLNELTKPRLTDDRAYQQVKDVAEGHARAGRTVDIDQLRYIKLAEYERMEEKAMSVFDVMYLCEKNGKIEDKHWDECRQIALYDNELRLALDLLSECYGALNALGKLAPSLPRDVQDYVEGLCVRIDSLREESARTTEVPADE